MALDAKAQYVAQARTLAILHHLDGRRKGITLRFLYEAGLIGKRAVIDLNRADLSEADLSGSDLWGVNRNFGGSTEFVMEFAKKRRKQR